jgi:hypothetical protein
MTSLAYWLIFIASSSCWSIVSCLPALVDNSAIALFQAQIPAPTGSALKVPTQNTLVVPGKSVGNITAKTTYTDLVKLFGRRRLTAKKVYRAEGQVEFPGTLITLGKNKSLTVVWKNVKKLQPIEVVIADPAWKTRSGIGVGTSLAKLRQILGEFQISGLYWDYGNQVVGLSPATQARYTGLGIQVDADPKAAKQFPADLQAVIGDILLSADNPHWKPLKMHVSYMSVYFSDNSSPQSGN